ncbi:MAG: lamin tail domain-containing protein, partial [Elusimicrobiota bacterium]|nr:lamin tail domain-containing protein [Elusimicrobiota bacterium]
LQSGNWELLQTGTNYITVRAFDVAGNTTTTIDAFVILKDTIPPFAITSLQATPGAFRGAIDLTWIAPGDDGTVGNIINGGYLIRYATYPITTANFESAITWSSGTITPKPFGQTETITITGLDPATTYYFAIKTRDKVQSPPNPAFNWSLISNVPSCLPRERNVWINEIYAYSTAGSDWVELYNDLPTTISLTGWTLTYDGSTVWTGTTENIPPGGFITITGLDFDNTLSKTIALRNNASPPVMVDFVKYPAHTTNVSISRISDGNADYLEFDPTPTQNYANAITTGVIKINEIDYISSEKFIELYNSSTSSQTLTNWYIRNRNNDAFKFTRNIDGKSFTGIDFSSVDNDGKTFSTAFADLSINDFIALENSSGQVIDRVTWHSDIENSRYFNKETQAVAYKNHAVAVSLGSIARENEKDTDVDASDFVNLSTPNYGMLNTTATVSANTLSYPESNSYIPRRALLDLVISTNSSGGSTDTIWFIRTGGSTDTKSPHIYRLTDLGINTALELANQTTEHVWLNKVDIDGYSLVDGAIYKLIFNTDTGWGAAQQIIRTNITYDASIHITTATDIARPYANNNKRSAMLKLTVQSNSPSAANAIKINQLRIKLTDGSGTNLTTAQAQALFKNIYIIADSTSNGTTGLYQYAIDTDIALSVSNSAFSIDADGYHSIPNIVDASVGTISAGNSKIFFVVLESSDNASAQTPNNFRIAIDPDIDVILVDDPSDVRQDISATTTVTSSSSTVIAPATKPAGTNWPYDTGKITKFENTVPAIGNNYLFIGDSDGVIIQTDLNGSIVSSYTATGVLTNPINSADLTGEMDSNGEPLYIYFGSKSGKIYKNSATNISNNIWTRDLPSGINSDVVAWYREEPAKIYAGTTDGYVFKISTSGADLWTAPQLGGGSGGIVGSPVLDEGFTAGVNSLWWGTSNGYVYRLNLVDGTIQSSTNVPSGISTSIQYDAGYYNQALNTCNVYFGTEDGTLYCRYGLTLSSIPADWQDRNFGSKINCLTGVKREGTNKYLYLATENGKIYKVDASSSNVVWEYDVGVPVRSSIFPTTNYIYFGTDDGYLYAIHKDDRAMKSGFPIAVGGEMRSGIKYDTGSNRIYFGANDGKIYCIQQ